MKTSFLPVSRFRFLVLAGWFGVALLARTWAVAASAPIRLIELVPTFESIGVTLTVDADAWSDQLKAEFSYRVATQREWERALTPVAADHQFRGSVLLLKPATRYEVRAQLLRGGDIVAEQTAVTTTWSDTVPIAREVGLTAGASNGIVISERGAPDGWIRYRIEKQGGVIDAGTAVPSAILLKNAAYVIIEGLTIRGGSEHAVHVVDSHDIRIVGCDIAEWGDPGKWGFYSDAKRKQWSYLDAAGKIIDRQAGIRVRGAGSQRVVLEYNLIHHPRGTANCWAFEHPHGPSGIVLSETGGNNVVRYNDLIAGDGHRWNDAIESEYNGNVNGGPYRDTDIHGNLLVSPNDDGTELDGGQINVRYWGNWIEGGFCGVSCAPNLAGPSYVFRNLIVSGDERGACGAGFKMGGDPGVTFLLNNTVYVGAYGLTSGHYGKNPSQIVSRNNVFAGPAGGQGRVRFDKNVAGDLDYDLVPPDGLIGMEKPQPGREFSGRLAVPSFVAPEERDFRLREGSPGMNAAENLPNLGGGDLGAMQNAARSNAWPLRPDAPEIRPARKVVRVRRGATTEFALDVSAREPWSAQAGEPWLSTTPDLTRRVVNCRLEARGLSTGMHRTFVSVRDERGHLRSVPVDVEVEPEATVAFRFEPEKISPHPGFEAVAAPDASGGGYVRVISAKKEDCMSFDFDVKTAGDYFVLARVRGTGPAAKVATQDSLRLQIDDGPEMTWDMLNLADDRWQWIAARPKEAVNGRFAFPAGRHRVTIGAREPLLLVDAMVVSNNPFAPADAK